MLSDCSCEISCACGVDERHMDVGHDCPEASNEGFDGRTTAFFAPAILLTIGYFITWYNPA